MAVNLMKFPTPEELAAAVATALLDAIHQQAGRTFTVALSGGRISTRLFESFVDQARTRGVSLATTHFFWADERCVPPTDTESNYRMARELLFAPLEIAEDRIHRIPGERLPEVAAMEAERDLRRIADSTASGLPVLDLVLLGLGEDGHVASLFPGDNPESEPAGVVYRAVNNSPKPPPERVTLSYGAIEAARQVWVVVAGAGKEAALRESLSPGGTTPCATVLRRPAVVFTDIPLK
jgi:6-phosphogluconolactonase